MPEHSDPALHIGGADTDLAGAYSRWEDAAAAVLAKASRIPVDELSDSAESLLSTPTRGGGAIRPLYTRKDETSEPGVPGHFPFVRGADPHRDVVQGWRVTERFGDATGGESVDAAAVNADLLDAMGSGTSGLWLRVGADQAHSTISVDNLADVLDGVYLDLIPVTLDAGTDGIAAARAFLDLHTKAAAAPMAAPPTLATTTSFGFSPLTAAFSGRPDVSAQAAAEFTATTNLPVGVRAFRVDGTDFATAGADNALELGLVVAAAVTHLRALTAAGLSMTQAFDHIGFAVAVDDDQFAAIAKLRALRRMWARVANVSGVPQSGSAPTHAVTDLAMYSQRDPWVNMLRTTLAAFGAGVGGADQVTVFGYDAALPLEARTSSAAFSRRIARNTQLLLLEESNIGRVLDPAGGSWFVESLTDDLAAAAWTVFTETEAQGGYRTALDSGWIAERVGTSLAAREVEVAHRRTSVTGVNEFPNLDERALGANMADRTDLPTATPRLARTARAFESLRDRSDAHLQRSGARPTVALLPLGSIAEHNARTSFVANLLASGGIATTNPGPLQVDDIAATSPVGPVAVICGAAKRYADEAVAALAAARQAGFSTVLLAGPDREWPDGATDSDKPDGFLKVGIDAIATLTNILDQLQPATGEAATLSPTETMNTAESGVTA